MAPSSSINKELPSGRPACPANRASTVGVPVDVVGRESRGERRVPGMIGWWVLEVVDDDDDDDEVELGERDDDERGRFRLRKDIRCFMYHTVKVVGVWCGVCAFTFYKLVFVYGASAIDYVITLSSELAT